MSALRIWGLLLIGGAAITLALHALGAPEDLYRSLYDELRSIRDVPDDPPDWSLDLIDYVSLVGGILELLVGAALLIADLFKTRRD